MCCVYICACTYMCTCVCTHTHMYICIYVQYMFAVAPWTALSLPLWVPLSSPSVCLFPGGSKLKAVCLLHSQRVATSQVESL